MTDLLITLLVSFTLGYTFDRLKIIGGMMIGALIASALLNITFNICYMPTIAKYLAQIIAGIFIGCSISKHDLKNLKYIYKPILLVLSMYFIINIISGLLIYNFSNLDAPTAFMSAVPGGISDIPIIAADFGANTSTVAAMQFIRLITGVALFPIIIKNFKIKNKNFEPHLDFELNEKTIFDYKKHSFSALLVLMIAIIGGSLGKIINLPGGVLVFSMLSSLLLKIKFEDITLPKYGRKIAQLISGAYIGSSITLEEVIDYKKLVVPIIILISCYFINCLLTGLMLEKLFNFNLKEGMLSASPAGASDMALISQDMGITSPRLVIIHVIRLITVIALFPSSINFILSLFF
ncbi:MAG: AbrB family transcriptional regulator [Lactovum sp.]